MTLDEMLAHVAIRDTIHRYNMAGDRVKIDDFVACFAEDALYESESFRLQGHQEIRAWMRSWTEERTGDASPVAYVRHNLTTCVIDLIGPDEARARTYYFVVTDIGPDHSGYYVDVLRRVGSRWLFAHRKVRTDWCSPASKFVPNNPHNS